VSIDSRKLVLSVPHSRRVWAKYLFASAGLFTVLKAQTVSVVWFVWDANTETDLAGYVLHWGLQSKVYTQSKVLTPDSTTTNLALSDGPDVGKTTWYVAIRAFNTANQFSGYSNEVRVDVPYEGQQPIRLPEPLFGVTAQVV